MKIKAVKLPSGNWNCRIGYTDADGKRQRKSFTAPTKAEALALATDFKLEKKLKKNPINRTLREATEAFINSRENLLSPSTLAGYKSISKNALQALMDRRIGSITAEEYQQALNEYGRDKQPKTVKSVHAFYHRILKEYGIDIADKATIKKKVATEIEIPTDEEVVEILQKVKGTRLEVFVNLIVALGLRRSEAIAIRWKDIDFKNNTVHIHNARVKNAEEEFVEKKTKNATSTRTLDLPPQLVELLKDKKGKPNDYVITENPKTLFSDYNNRVSRGEFKYRPHSLRHYYASVMLKQGVPNKYAKERMGHASEYMLTRVYQHIDKQKQAEYSVVLNSFYDNLAKEAEETPQDAATVE